jgi:hypothetical protein
LQELGPDIKEMIQYSIQNSATWMKEVSESPYSFIKNLNSTQDFSLPFFSESEIDSEKERPD